ncbi:MAG: hypothetical protein ACK4M3_08150 [Pyrobaculum sp.]
MVSYISKARCPICGVEFPLAAGRREATCPNGHVFHIDTVLDCEIRDWDKFALLPLSTQQAVLEVIQSGKIPNELAALMKRLREAGVVICT